MSDSYLGNGFNNGPTPRNPWADYLSNRSNRKHDQLMENSRHTNNVELASMQHQQAQSRDKKNYKRGKKEAGLDREWKTGENIRSQDHQTGENIRSQQFESAENKKSSRRGRKLEAMKLQFEANETYLARLHGSAERAATAVDTKNQTREEGSQERRTYKSNLKAGAEVVRGMAQPTDVGDRSIGGYGISRDGVQASHGAPTKPPKTGGSTSSSSSSGTGRTLSDHPKNVKRREARAAAKKANTSTV
jgi:hypothetical protein